ncbi:hypothetical protein ACFORO_12340 [Amycolatopsis halotolerans]|uniref:Uncharacterized protein n=1 Tax=Amycolatopsis halotolerans TaxID=330083 RepID=A0ABV7QCT8_9PSEU
MNLDTRIVSRLADHERMETRTSDAIIAGENADASFAYMTRFFTEAAYLVVLRRADPRLALAIAEWVEGALDDGDTACEVADRWRKDAVSGRTPWLPDSIASLLPDLPRSAA